MNINSRSPIKRAAIAGLIVALLVLATFAVGSAFGVETWVANWLKSPIPPVAFGLLVVSLLIADVALPVPSSLVILASGSVLGFGVGSAVSAVGLLLGNVVGYLIGRCWKAPIIRHSGRSVAWALTLVALTRCVPVVAETGAVVAGRERLPFPGFVIASGAGSAGMAVALAYFGSILPKVL